MPIWCHSQPDITNTLRAMATFSTMSLHMLQMGIWSPHHAVTTTLVGSHLENQLKSWITAGCQMIPSCSGWGSHPTWNDSHIKRWLTNILCCGWGYGAPIMLLPPHLWDKIWKSAEIMDLCWVSNDTIIQWLRLSSRMEWFPHQLKTYTRWLPNNICCGWGYGAFIMLLPPHLWDQIWKSGEIMDLCWVSNDTIMQWLRLSSRMEWFPHPLETYTRWLTSIICCGWGYGAPTMLLPPHLRDRIWKVGWKIMDHCWVSNDTIMQWLRLSSHME
jgi:hypothetical protein